MIFFEDIFWYFNLFVYGTEPGNLQYPYYNMGKRTIEEKTLSEVVNFFHLEPTY